MNRSTARRLLRLGSAEIQRAMSEMRVPGFPRPYFISYLIRDEERWRLKAKFGSLQLDAHERDRNALADVRVGSYRRDQVRDGGLNDNDKESETYGYVELPFGGGDAGVRHGLWQLTDARYREAVEGLLERKSKELTYRDPDRALTAFEKRPSVVADQYQSLPEVDVEAWARFVEKASLIAKRYPEIKDSYVEFEADHVVRIYTSSEGVRIIQSQTIWSVECYLWLLSDKGDAHPWTLKHIVADPRELPSARVFHGQIREAVATLRKLAGAPSVRAFSGPALLEPVPAGLLMHEAVGHRLEGNRLLASGEGQTFKDSMGKRILPEFLSIRDNPTLSRFGKRSLVGHYRYDDEGVEAQDTLLVDRGKLCEFMSSRIGIARRHRSNGHGRSNYHERAISRMGVTVVEAHEGLNRRRLKQALLDEIERQGAEFGIRIIDASTGETATDAYNFQAFLGEVNLATKVYPDGREELIRGVNFVGTPLNSIRSIIAAGKDPVVDNAFCGAESGYVPVSTICPALVVTELELQAKAHTPYSPYTFPIPWASRKK